MSWFSLNECSDGNPGGTPALVAAVGGPGWIGSVAARTGRRKRCAVGLALAALAGLALAGCDQWAGPAGRGNKPAAGDDDPFAARREAMVKQQLAAPGRGIRDQRVLEAMRTVPRHEFVPKKVREMAYADHPLPIGHDQTISQPFIVAFMTEALAPKSTDRVLEIGTGSGYQAAVLAGMVAKVYTIEIVAPLAREATATIKRLGYANVHVKEGDGFLGWPEHAPFDAIMVTCAPEEVPPPLVEQLKEGGRMIIPVGPALDQQLVMLEKRDGKVQRKAVLPVRFVPMTGKARGDSGR